MNAPFLRDKFAAGLDYDAYVRTGTPKQIDHWTQFYQRVTLTGDQQQLIAAMVRQVKVLVLSGLWCGDCVQQVPILARIAQANPAKITLRIIDRDQHPDLAQQVRINAGDRVPVVLFCAEDDELVGWFGDRTLSRYRAIAARQLGPSCPLPGAPVAGDELAAATQDWVDQIERVHLLLRLSTRLRQRHGD